MCTTLSPSVLVPPSHDDVVADDTVTVSGSQSSHESGMLSSNCIPSHWRPEVVKCIEDKKLTKEGRNFIIRTLITLMMARIGPKVTKNHCELVSRKLILKYPFMKDDMGSGYVSNK